MKKILSFILTITLIISVGAGFVNINISSVTAAESDSQWPTAPSLVAKSAVLIEASTGTILYDKKCHKRMYPASITKIMTALLTIENCKLDEEVTFSENAVKSLSYDDANFACQVGEKMSVKDCLYVLMLESANEVATALAEHVAGSTEKFADMMNSRAKQAGATDTHFANANGLHDPNHYITAYDMAMITRAASKYSFFNDIVNTTSYTVKSNNKRKESATANQRHKMVWPASGYYYDGVIGGKTGYTDQSGTTLVTYAKQDGMTIIVVVLNSHGTNAYKDTTTLFNYGFDNFNLANVSQNDTRFSQGETDCIQSPFCSSTDSIYIDKESAIVLPKNANFSKLTSQVNFNTSEDSFATISYKFGDNAVGTAKIKYERNTASKDTAETSVKAKESQTSDANNSSGANKTNEKSSSNSKPLKIPTFVFPVVIIILILIALFVIIRLQQRKINRIRAMKRRRQR